MHTPRCLVRRPASESRPIAPMRSVRAIRVWVSMIKIHCRSNMISTNKPIYGTCESDGNASYRPDACDGWEAWKDSALCEYSACDAGSKAFVYHSRGTRAEASAAGCGQPSVNQKRSRIEIQKINLLVTRGLLIQGPKRHWQRTQCCGLKRNGVDGIVHDSRCVWIHSVSPVKT